MTLSYRERLEAMLAEVGARFGVKEARGTLLTLELGHDDWAEMIGSSRPMVSRLIAEMVQNRVLAREGKHYILLADGASEKPAPSTAADRSRLDERRTLAQERHDRAVGSFFLLTAQVRDGCSYPNSRGLKSWAEKRPEHPSGTILPGRFYPRGQAAQWIRRG
jgi:hypothetical protein